MAKMLEKQHVRCSIKHVDVFIVGLINHLHNNHTMEVIMACTK